VIARVKVTVPPQPVTEAFGREGWFDVTVATAHLPQLSLASGRGFD
jgi:hypothetical protein